jgi:hypothetical protein
MGAAAYASSGHQGVNVTSIVSRRAWLAEAALQGADGVSHGPFGTK